MTLSLPQQPSPGQSPLFHAQNADRYQRQELIDEYERAYAARLIVFIDVIFNHSFTLFEELLYDVDLAADLHVMVASPGGDGDIAVRLVRAAQARCRELTVIVPDQAKSAATLFALGAHHIIMGPASDLGPIDPQFMDPANAGGALISAKDIIAAVEDAAAKVQARPETYAFYASLYSDITGLMVQQAKSALGRTDDMLEEALKSNPARTPSEVKLLKKQLKAPLITKPKTHSALFGFQDALATGLPIIAADPSSDQWRLLWRLWTKYYVLGPGMSIYEGTRVSQIGSWIPHS